MLSLKRISQVYGAAPVLPFDDSSKIVLMSDCHRGDGSWADTFAKNQNLFFVALNHYYREQYTYIELGDGDELWENKKLSEIVDIYYNIFWLMSKFHQEGRLFFLFGNHDAPKKSKNCVKNDLGSSYDVREKKHVPLFPGIEILEGLILKHRENGNRLFLLHGHQADFFNDTLWRLSRFLVRYVWKPLELIGVNDPTSAARNNKRKLKVEKKLVQWVEKTNMILIAGHTHRPILPEPGEPRYFNDGSCVHPRCITAMEISNGEIALVKWCYLTREDGTVYVGRESLVDPRKLTDYFAPAEAA